MTQKIFHKTTWEKKEGRQQTFMFCWIIIFLSLNLIFTLLTLP